MIDLFTQPIEPDVVCEWCARNAHTYSSEKCCYNRLLNNSEAASLSIEAHRIILLRSKEDRNLALHAYKRKHGEVKSLLLESEVSKLWAGFKNDLSKNSRR
jgi:hypothetical protein